MQGDTFLGGFWCSEVLGRLEDAVDGTLPDDEKCKVEAHVHVCDQCARFGARYAALVGALKGKREGTVGDSERVARVLAQVWATDAESSSSE